MADESEEIVPENPDCAVRLSIWHLFLGLIVVVLLIGGPVIINEGVSINHVRMKILIMAVKQYESHYGELPLLNREERPLADEEYRALIGILIGENARGIRFLEPTNPTDPHHYEDAWGRRYELVMDANYDGEVEVPQVTGPVYVNIAVWSRGEDLADAGDDLCSWQD